MLSDKMHPWKHPSIVSGDSCQLPGPDQEGVRFTLLRITIDARHS